MRNSIAIGSAINPPITVRKTATIMGDKLDTAILAATAEAPHSITAINAAAKIFINY